MCTNSYITHQTDAHRSYSATVGLTAGADGSTLDLVENLVKQTPKGTLYICMRRRGTWQSVCTWRPGNENGLPPFTSFVTALENIPSKNDVSLSCSYKCHSEYCCSRLSFVLPFGLSPLHQTEASCHIALFQCIFVIHRDIRMHVACVLSVVSYIKYSFSTLLHIHSFIVFPRGAV